MGADLYIQSVSRQVRAKYDPLFDAAVKKRNDFMSRGMKAEAEKAQKEVEKYYNLSNSEGYFRDSYNDSSLFWMLGLSWWQLAEEGVIDDRGYISPDNAYLLAQLVKELPYVKPIRADLFSDTNSVEEVQEYFDTKRKNFIKFLELAHKLDEAIYASV
jgi:hypothetical protein